LIGHSSRASKPAPFKLNRSSTVMRGLDRVKPGNDD
jgi:hypothetical protein